MNEMCSHISQYVFNCICIFPYISAFQDFLSRAKTIEHLEEYTRMQKFAEAKAQDKNLLLKQREIRKKVTKILLN